LNAITATGNLVAVLQEGFGVRVFDITDPLHPQQVATRPLPPMMFKGALAATNNTLFVSHPDLGIEALRIVAAPRVVIAHPQLDARITRGYDLTIRWSEIGIPTADWTFTLERPGGISIPLPMPIISESNDRWIATGMVKSDVPEACDYRVRVWDNATGANARSEPFCIGDDWPAITVKVEGSIIVISWPARFTGYSVFTSPTPNGGWGSAIATVQQSGDTFTAVVPATDQARYFTLGRATP
jgi:hypothetical protein